MKRFKPDMSVFTPPVIAILITLLAGLWIVSGAITKPEDSHSTPLNAGAMTPDSPYPQVQVRTQTATPFHKTILLTGRTEASRRVELRGRIEAQVSEIHAEKGDFLKEGAPILNLEVEDRAAQVDKSRALLNHRKREYEAARQLTSKGHQSENTMVAAKADYEQARADLVRRENDLSFTAITAPFAGVLNDRQVEIGDYLRDGDPIGILVDLNPILIVAEVTENEAASLTPGMIGQGDLVNGDTLKAELTYISSIANPATRTFRIELEAPNPDNQVPEGITAKIRLPVDTRAAHHISPSILTLDDLGIIGVKTIDDQDTVRFNPVRIVGSDENGMWLTGLPETSRLIIVGQEFVTEGQIVTPIETGSAPLTVSEDKNVQSD